MTTNDDGPAPAEGDALRDLIRAPHPAPLTPAAAAERLGVKAAMLRRHARTYEDIFGPLPRDQRGARLYPVDAVQRLHHAAELFHTRTVASVAEALERIAAGRDPVRETSNAETDQADQAERPALPPERTLARLLTEVQAHQADHTRLEAALADLSARLAPEGDDGATVAALQARVIALHEEVRDLEGRNRALRAELARVRAEVQADTPRRPLWRRILPR